MHSLLLFPLLFSGGESPLVPDSYLKYLSGEYEIPNPFKGVIRDLEIRYQK